MSIHVALNHVMHYRYDRQVALGPQIIRLRPAPHCRTRILSYSLKIVPSEHFINWQQDPQSNYLARVVFPKPTRELRIEVDLVAEMAVLNPFDFFLESYAQKFPFRYDPAEERALAPFRTTGPATPLLTRYLAAIAREPQPTVDFLVDLNRRLAAEVKYVIRMEPGVQDPEETLEKRSGSCRDSAELLVQILRHLGFAARFVSGYLIQLTADLKPAEGPAGPAQDFTDLHAWCEVYLPGAGWIGLDATSGLLTGEGHIPLACTPEPQSAAPLSGIVEPCETTFEYVMRVARIWEAPRVTRPYTEAQWQAIDALGKRVDQTLTDDDVRLTMGGEPTFVSSEDSLAPEWNTAALGENKRIIAAQLFRRLKERYAPRGLAHFGQGKWYPGEPLPRWSLNCFWRKDGEAVWNDAALIADETREYPGAAANASRLLCQVAARLGIGEDHVFAAFEDALYYLWRERKLPANIDLGVRGADRPRRARTAGAHSRSHARCRPSDMCCRSPRPPRVPPGKAGPGCCAASVAHLIPGDSPMGFRLPLDSLPWVRPTDFPHMYPPDPNQSFEALAKPAPDRVQSRTRRTPHGRRHRASRGNRHRVDRDRLRGRWQRRDRCRVRCGRSAGRSAGARDNGPNLDVRRGAQGGAVRLHAADPVPRGLSRAHRRGRVERGRAPSTRDHRGLRAAARSAPDQFQGHARSGRHRGQRAAERGLGRARRAHPPSVRGCRRPASCARKSS